MGFIYINKTHFFYRL